MEQAKIFQEEVLKVANNFHNALVEAKYAALQDYLFSITSYGHSVGVVQDKKAIIEDIKNGKMAYTAYAIDNVTCMAKEKMATIRYHAIINVLSSGKPGIINTNVLETWVKNENQWQLLGRQAYDIPTNN